MKKTKLGELLETGLERVRGPTSGHVVRKDIVSVKDRLVWGSGELGSYNPALKCHFT